MNDLFLGEEDEGIKIPLEGADVRFFPSFLEKRVADQYFSSLLKQTKWEEKDVFVWGRWQKQPRLIAWHGDVGAAYKYSGTKLEPHPWTSELQSLRNLVQGRCHSIFNSVLLNLYRNEKDSMGWHSDDEKELGQQPVIASVSLGQSREFLFKHRTRTELGIKKIVLEHGSLLLMAGETQQNWLHAINKERARHAPRINLTFRRVFMS
jgi:alkylated DNA repair dioxygenase AlkB